MTDETTFLRSLYASGWWVQRFPNDDDLSVGYEVRDNREDLRPFLLATFDRNGGLCHWTNLSDTSAPPRDDQDGLLAFVRDARLS